MKWIENGKSQPVLGITDEICKAKLKIKFENKMYN